MNVLMQLYKNRETCNERLARAKRMVEEAVYPFEKQRAAMAVRKAEQSLRYLQREIITEEERQDKDERAWLDN
jgi:hypothetical protein